MSRTYESVGWLGTGRMGTAMARRLVETGRALVVWNRTRSKTDELAEAGATVVKSVEDLGRADVVFTTVSTPQVLVQVISGPNGLLAAPELPELVVDCSTVDVETSSLVREALSRRGVQFLASPISGNPRVVAEGRAVFASSGPKETFEAVHTLLTEIAQSAVWSGGEEEARVVKICHNLYLGMVVQSVSEVISLAEKSGVPRSAFLDFLNGTVLGSEWVKERTPDLLRLDWTPTFTTELLRKDFDLGLEAARQHEVPLPLGSLVHELIQTAIGRGYRELDFLSMFEMQALSSGIDLSV